MPTAHQNREANIETQSDHEDHMCRILIVEDNLDSAESLRLWLEIDGYVVDVAHTGAAALEKALVFRPGVVLCDIGLPKGMDGYAVARAIRADDALKSVYLVALTGYAQPEDQQSALDAGYDIHLTKPVDPDKLEQILDRLQMR
jgi:two-component system CheB/CheR fusion protein